MAALDYISDVQNEQSEKKLKTVFENQKQRLKIFQKQNKAEKSEKCHDIRYNIP